MKIVSNGILIVAGVYAALGVMYLRYWFDERARRDYLAFSIACISAMLFGLFEKAMMTSATGADYLFYAYWSFYPGTVALIAIAWLGYRRLSGRKWLFITYTALRVIATIIHVLTPNGINFRQVTGVGINTFWGEPLSYPIAVANPWMILPQSAHFLLLVLFLEASFRCWRRGDFWQAITFGTGTLLYASTILVFAVTVLWGLEPIPLAMTFAVIFIIAPMLYELNFDMHRAAMLTQQLAEREARLTETSDQLRLAAAAADVGMWTRKVGGEIVWISEKAGEIFGFEKDTPLTREKLLRSIHPDDRLGMSSLIKELEAGGTEFTLDYRVIPEDGQLRWLHSRGRVEELNGERVIRGAIVDITRVKAAEEAIRDLTGRLMNAQERERARLARELHDGLNQSVALLSIKIGMLRNDPKDIAHVKQHLGEFAAAVERLSEDVHRISYELHPANLNQLGLEAALSTFCDALSSAHEFKIVFSAKAIPRDLRQDISLCLYRVAQESLQNVIRHSDATSAQVSIVAGDDAVRLVISDDGKGFDRGAAIKKGGLGLISLDERVRRLHGATNVVSRVGEGTRIEVIVPLEEDTLEYFPKRLSSTVEIQ